MHRNGCICPSHRALLAGQALGVSTVLWLCGIYYPERCSSFKAAVLRVYVEVTQRRVWISTSTLTGFWQNLCNSLLSHTTYGSWRRGEEERGVRGMPVLSNSCTDAETCTHRDTHWHFSQRHRFTASLLHAQPGPLHAGAKQLMGGGKCTHIAWSCYVIWLRL